MAEITWQLHDHAVVRGQRTLYWNCCRTISELGPNVIRVPSCSFILAISGCRVDRLRQGHKPLNGRVCAFGCQTARETGRHGKTFQLLPMFSCG